MSTQPVVPTPAAVAPVHEGAPSATTNPEPAAAAPEAPKPTEPAKPAEGLPDDPAALKAEIARLRQENGKDRTNAKQAAADDARSELAQTIGKALGLVKDDAPVDPTQLTEQITAAQADAKKAQVALAVYQNAATAGADPLALLDSASFLAKAASLDPSDVASLTAAMQEAVTVNPRLGAANPAEPPLMSPNPGQGTSGSGAPTPKPIDQQIADAEKAGDWATAGALKAQQLMDIRKTTSP